MADKTVELSLPAAVTGMLLKISALGADTLLNTGGDTLTEATNFKGVYTATVTEALAGRYRANAYLSDGITLIGAYEVDLVDTVGVYRCFEPGMPSISATGVVNANDSAGAALATASNLATANTGITNLATAVANIQNNTRVVITTPEQILVPATSTTTYKVHLYLYDEVGNMESPDSAPTVTLVNAAGTDRSGRLGSTTMTLVGTGHYTVTYTSTSTDTLDEQLNWEFSIVEGGATRVNGRQSVTVDTILSSAINAINTKLGTPATSVSADIAAVKTDTGAAATSLTTILNRLGAWTGSARNTILGAMQALFRKDADATVPSDINVNLGSGAGAASNTTDSVEAIRDRGDAAWVTGASSSGGNKTINQRGRSVVQR